MILSSFCFLKQSESNTANGVSYVRAFCGQPFTQAQHLMHFSATVLHSSPFIMAPAGQCFTQYPQCVQRSASTCGVRGIGTPLLRNLTTLRKKRSNGKKGWRGRWIRVTSTPYSFSISSAAAILARIFSPKSFAYSKSSASGRPDAPDISHCYKSALLQT